MDGVTLSIFADGAPSGGGVPTSIGSGSGPEPMDVDDINRVVPTTGSGPLPEPMDVDP